MKSRNRAGQSPVLPDEFDDGGWILPQVIVWIVTRKLADAQLVKTKSGYFHYKNYPSMLDPNFPKQRPGESETEIWNRISQYHAARLASEIPAIKQARVEIMQSLRRDRLFAIDKHGERVGALKWQVFDLSSDEVADFRYPSSLVREQWRAPEVNRAISQNEVNSWVEARLSEAQASGKRPPKQLSLISEGQSEIRASVRQIKLAIQQAPSKLRSTRGRPREK